LVCVFLTGDKLKPALHFMHIEEWYLICASAACS
jgi:hypothetical protein